MRRTPVIGLILAGALSRAALAQDFPSPPPEHPGQEDGDSGLWFREPNVGYGPFHYVSLALFPSLRSGFETQFPSSLPSGRFELRVTESWVKNLSISDEWQMDFELLRTNIAFSWGLSDTVRLDVGIETAERTGGTLDAFILGFHHAFGLALGSRSHFARNDNRIEIQPPDGGPKIVVDRNDPQPYEQAALATLRHTLTYGDEDVPAVTWALSARGKLGPGDAKGGSPLDLSFSLAVSKDIGSVHLYLGGNFQWYGRESFFGLKLRTTQESGTAGFEWNLAPAFSLVCQWMITSGGVDRLEDLSRPIHEITAGFKWEVGTGILIELAIVENVINFQNSPDFGVHAGIAFRW
jgi:hypothetical protein